jgi:hypothetical protein
LVGIRLVVAVAYLVSARRSTRGGPGRDQGGGDRPSGKSIDGGRPKLRRTLARHGLPILCGSRCPEPQGAEAGGAAAEQDWNWYSFGAATAWLQRCIGSLAGTGTVVAIVPAGTANLLASNLGIPGHRGAVVTGLHGRRRDRPGSPNGERFAVMAGRASMPT